MHEQINAPFTKEQVEGLNRWQGGGGFHEFTCGNPEHPIGKDKVLIAYTDGWECPNCEYHQDWAWNFMVLPEGTKSASQTFRDKVKEKTCPSTNHDKEEE